MVSRSVYSVLSIVAFALGIIIQVYVYPLVESGGFFRSVEPLNTENCETIEGLQACEKFIIHSSGLIYLACASSPYSRTIWMPTLDHLNAKALRELPSKDYVATYEPQSRRVTKLKVLGLMDPRGLNLHGMDVVQDERDSALLWVYLVNHRPPLNSTIDAAKTGADSVVELFKTRIGSNSIEWVQTVSDPQVIVTPNDIVGGSNGKEFWFTNDHAVKTGVSRKIHMYLSIKSTSVGYCHLDTGCKIAADKLYSSNGIVRDKMGRVWVASSVGGYVTIHGQRADKTLVPIEIVKIGRAIDNVALALDGSIIVSAFPQGAHFTGKAVKNVNLPSPVSAFRISGDTGKDYKVEKIYESDGVSLGSASTTASMYQDTLYIHGLLAHRMLVCKIPVETTR